MIDLCQLEQPVAGLLLGALAPANTTTCFERRRLTVEPGKGEMRGSQRMMLLDRQSIPYFDAER
jgi:hypothetical protein